jgi:hypothetical protein
LQIINRFGKRKGILNTKLAVDRNSAGNRARPNSQPFLSSHSGAAQCGPAKAGLPSPCAKWLVAQLSSTPPLTEPARPTRNRSSTRHSSYPIRNLFKPHFIPFDLSPKSLISRVRCDHESCRSLSPLRPCVETPINSTTDNLNFAQD